MRKLFIFIGFILMLFGCYQPKAPRYEEQLLVSVLRDVLQFDHESNTAFTLLELNRAHADEDTYFRIHYTVVTKDLTEYEHVVYAKYGTEGLAFMYREVDRPIDSIRVYLEETDRVFEDYGTSLHLNREDIEEFLMKMNLSS